MTQIGIVAATTTTEAIDDNHQRKSFYAVGRHWLFFSDGLYLYYSSSKDGIIWDTPTFVSAANPGYRISVWFDGVHVHYAREYGGEVYYRMGTPYSDGSISWAAAEQIVHGGFNLLVSIAVDSNGYPWVAYQHSDDGRTTYPYVSKSSKKDGTWINDTGFPYQLSSVPGGYWSPIVLPLTDGKVYVLYQLSYGKILGKLWNGGWSSEETCTTTNVDQCAFIAVAEDDDIHVVFRGGVPNFDLRYVKRTYTVGWGSEVILKDSLGDIRQGAHISIDKESGNLYIFFGNLINNTIDLKVYRAGTWEDWFVYLTEPNTLQSMPISFYQKNERAIGVAWVRGEKSPYDVRYEVVTILPTVLKNTPNSGL